MYSRRILGIIFLFLFCLSLINIVCVQSLNNDPVSSIHFTFQKVSISKQNYNQNDIQLLIQDKYHNLSEVYSELEHFNQSNPELIDYSSIGYSYYGNPIPLITVTDENIPEEMKGKTYVVAHHHAREYITIEHTLRIIRDLINDYGEDQDITSLLNRTIIYFIVTLNPDSLDYALYTNQWQRKTMKPYDDDGDNTKDEDGPEDIDEDGRISEYAFKPDPYDDEWTFYKEGIDNDDDGVINEDWIGGVDLNRNYPFHWNDSACDSGTTSDKSDETYPGPEPASENETHALIEFVKKHNFTHAISLHSGTNATLFDWSFTNTIHQAEAPLYADMLTNFQSFHLLPDSFFSEINDVTYTSAGEWGDWTYSSQHTIPLTLEIYHMEGSEYFKNEPINTDPLTYEFDTIFEYFNPPQERIEHLHQELIGFEKFWLDLTPSIELSQITTRILNSGNRELALHLKSGSLYFNTTDNAKVSVITPFSDINMTHPPSIGTLLPHDETILIIILQREIPDYYYFYITITSEWGSDLQLKIEASTIVDSEEAPGFTTLFAVSALICISYVIKKRLKK